MAVNLAVALSASADAFASVALVFARSATLLAVIFVRTIGALKLSVAFGAKWDTSAIGTSEFVATAGTSAFVFAAGAVSSAVASLVLVDAGAVGALIFRASFGFGRLSRAVCFVAVVDAVNVSVANPFRLNALALTEVLVVVALNGFFCRARGSTSTEVFVFIRSVYAIWLKVADEFLIDTLIVVALPFAIGTFVRAVVSAWRSLGALVFVGSVKTVN